MSLKYYLFSIIKFIKDNRRYFTCGIIVIFCIMLFIPSNSIGYFFILCCKNGVPKGAPQATTYFCLITIFLLLSLAFLVYMILSIFKPNLPFFITSLSFVCNIATPLLSLIINLFFVKYGKPLFDSKYWFLSWGFWVNLVIILILLICLILARWHTRTTPPIPIEKPAKPKKLSNSDRIAELEKQLSELKKDD